MAETDFRNFVSPKANQSAKKGSILLLMPRIPLLSSRLVVTALLALSTVAARADDALPPIEAEATHQWYEGKFVWSDLFTSDPKAAETFYKGLFGWTATRLERHGKAYFILSSGDRPMAGIVFLPERIKEESKGRWIGFVSVADVPAAAKKLTASGGKTLFPAHDVPDRGVQAVVEDPQGALVGLIHSASGDPGEYRAEVGEWIWRELFARDPAAASKTYQTAVGYESYEDTREARPGGSIFASGGFARASVASLPDRPGAHPAWLNFVRVASVDDAAAKAVSLGGRILVQPKTTLRDSKMAILADPLGAAFGVVELLDEPASPVAAPSAAMP